MARVKVFNYGVWTKDEVSVEIVAKNKKEADKKLQKMLDNDEIRWEKAMSVDGGRKYYGMTKKETENMKKNELDMDEEYDVVEIPCGDDDILALFSNGRIHQEQLPDGLYAYDLRGSDDDPGEPCNLEKHVVVNHAGSVITAEPVPIPECGYLDLGEGLNFTDEGMTIRQFLDNEREGKEFKVHVTATLVGSVTVKAKTKEDAEEKFKEMWDACKYTTSDMELDDVSGDAEEIKESKEAGK